MSILSTTTVRTMLSTEISALTGKRHTHVIRDIENAISQLEKDDPNLVSGFKSTTYAASNGKNEKCYELSYEATMLILTGYNITLRAKVIERWRELETKNQVQPMSHLEILAQSAMALVEMDKRQTKLEEDVKLLAAKIEKSPQEHFTVAGFASLRGVNVNVREASVLGRKASKLSKEWEMTIGKAHSEIFGEVNTYHVDVLSKVFSEIN